jgi:ribonucleoside-diphosphate reductase alpha chain
VNIFQQAISEKVWDTKYRYRIQDKIIDQTIEDTWRRVATAVAIAEQPKNTERFSEDFYDILAGFRFLPSGRILAGAGTKHAVTLFNCFVMPILEDSLPGIFDSLKEAALTLQQGGGVGYDFSSLRPRGYPVMQTGKIASGPVSFMRIWNEMCKTMGLESVRSGAMVGILRCDHPDIEEFIHAKNDPHDLECFKISVLISDAFMQCVNENREWELIFPAAEEDLTDTVLRHWSNSAEPVACRVVCRINARDLWEKIVKSAPGVLFEDTINRQNNLWYREWISATTPSSEIPLPVYGACHLGAINLTQFVNHPLKPNASIDWQGIKKTVQLATRFLDNVTAISRYPLKMQRQEIFATRRIGLGITGLADVFVMLGIQYGSDASLKLAKEIMQCVSESTWQASILLAQERGVFAGFHAQKYLQGNFVQQLPKEMREAIEKTGIRNSHHNAIAPTATISVLANNISPGIEPLTDAEKLSPEQHLAMQTALQPFVDNAISKKIILPTDFPLEQLNEIYTEAYTSGLKGCTLFRSKS